MRIMYNIDVKNIKKGRNYSILFLVIGTLFLAIFGSLFVLSIVKLNELGSTVISKRVYVESYLDDEGTRMYRPIYYYEVGGEEYGCSLDSPSSINPGTTNKTVYYDAEDPSNCMTEDSKPSIWGIISMLIPLLFIIFAIFNMRKINKRLKSIKELNRKGKLVKNLPYRLESSGVAINNIPVLCPVIDYILPSGSTVVLKGDPRYDRRTFDADGKVDLLIDESNPENYFIDFEINRISGNLPTDYYNHSDSNLQDIVQADQ